MKNLLLILVIIISPYLYAQKADFLKIKKYRVAFLDDRVKETSGLSFFKEKLYTFNDSGNSAELYEVDKNNGKIIRTFKTNLINNDWEALTNDGENFYVGDFGNNMGVRKDLTIYKIPYQKLDDVNAYKVPDSERALDRDGVSITFFYPEQEDFSPQNLKTDFDAEAMIYLNGKLHIFTKEWSSKSTTHYTLDPGISEKQQAEKTESYKTGFVVTDASYFDKKLYLIGYTKKTEVFLDVFNETEPGIFFKEAPQHYYLGSSLSIGQMEGVAVNEDGIYISGEKFNFPLGMIHQSFYFIPKEKLKH